MIEVFAKLFLWFSSHMIDAKSITITIKTRDPATKHYIQSLMSEEFNINAHIGEPKPVTAFWLYNMKVEIE